MARLYATLATTATCEAHECRVPARTCGLWLTSLGHVRACCPEHALTACREMEESDAWRAAIDREEPDE
jgi:hypothetical protein